MSGYIGQLIPSFILALFWDVIVIPISYDAPGPWIAGSLFTIWFVHSLVMFIVEMRMIRNGTYAEYLAKRYAKKDKWKFFRSNNSKSNSYTSRSSTSGSNSSGSSRMTYSSSSSPRSRYGMSKFFAECKTEEEFKAKYRKLVKQYHPDSPTGNAEIFMRIQAEYDKYK